MTLDWKMPAIVAGACLVLAMLTGIIVGNQFWVVVLKSLLSALGAGGAAFGLRWLALKFLPGLTDGGEAEIQTGKAVDIKVGQAEDDGFVDAGTEPSPAGTKDVDTADEGVLAEEIEELKAAPILADKEPEDPAALAPARPPETIGEVDVLPDLDVFSDSFVPPPMEGEGGQAEPPVGADTSRTARSRGGAGGDDPDTIAKAVRTMLTRERKG